MGEAENNPWLGASIFVVVTTVIVMMLQLGSGDAPATEASEGTGVDGGTIEEGPGWMDEAHVAAGPDPAAMEIVAELTRDSLEPFASAEELDTYLARLAEARRLQNAAEERAAALREREITDNRFGIEGPSEQGGALSATPPADESITNTQEVGVDEGGIVKTHGDHLVVLRRGRLFSVRLGATGVLTPIAMIDAPAPGADGGFYDEMLIHEDRIVVVGYDYEIGATELGIFTIDAAGALTREATHYLRSDDYFSSRNYASRLIGSTLIFYMPLGFTEEGPAAAMGDEVELTHVMPAVRTGQGPFRDIVRANQIFRPIQEVLRPTLHTVVACDLNAEPLACVAQGILGPAGRSFYVSPSAVYVWVGRDSWISNAGEPQRPVVYRLPFGAEARPGAIRAGGMPIDQFSFREADGHLNVLVSAAGGGDAMWAPEVAAGDLALMRVRLTGFAEGVMDAPHDAFAALPRIDGRGLHDRYVGDYLFYGSEEEPGIVACRYAGGGEARRLEIPHSVSRIEVLGHRALAVGTSDEGLHFTGLGLGERATIDGSVTLPGASEGEERSHGFFYRAASPTAGTLGLPVAYYGEEWDESEWGSAGVAFMSVSNAEQVAFSPLGALDADGETTEDDCQVSCDDWYGNARPIFYRGRVFALLGYELVEGRIAGGRITEIARANLYDDQPN